MSEVQPRSLPPRSLPKPTVVIEAEVKPKLIPVFMCPFIENVKIKNQNHTFLLIILSSSIHKYLPMRERHPRPRYYFGGKVCLYNLLPPKYHPRLFFGLSDQ